MASYFIIGGDKKEYGPISGDDIRQWIVEGRLNAVTEAKAENETEWGLLGAFPEFADLLGKAPPPNIGPVKTAASDVPSMDFVDRDYEVDIGGCVSRGWEVFQNNFGFLFLAFLIVVVIRSIAGGILNGILTVLIPKAAEEVEAIHLVHNFVLSGLLAAIAGPLMGGLYYVFLQKVRKLPVEIGDVFQGFKKCFQPLFLGYLVMTWISALCLVPFNLVTDAKLWPLLGKLQQQSSPEDLQNVLTQMWSILASSMPVLLICMLPATYFVVSLQFTLPLIIDKQMGVTAAIQTGFKMVHKHWWQVFALVIVLDLVGLVGGLACCIGILATLPISTAALMVAYETIFGAARKN